MLVLTWVTFLFAPGLPILIPIALLGMVLLYYSDRVALAYLCVRPRTYNDKVLETTLNLLRYAPFLYISMGAWVYSN